MLSCLLSVSLIPRPRISFSGKVSANSCTPVIPEAYSSDLDQIHSACRQMEMEFHEYSRVDEPPPSLLPIHYTDSVFRVNSFLSNFLVQRRKEHDTLEIILLPRGESIKKWQEFANDPIDTSNRPAKSQEVS